MSALDPRLTRWLLWIAPFAVLALAIGLQTGWGSELRRAPPVDAAVAPAPVATAVMPEFRIDGGVDAMRATVDRPLFNATRRPAPTLASADAKSTMQRGQFVLTGTMIDEKVAVAFLKDTGGTGKSRSVKQGDAINGMRVAEVTTDRVRLTLGDETEELELKVVKGPKTTVQAQPEPPPAPVAAAQPAPRQQPQGGAVVQPAGQGQRGRAGRSQGAGGPPGSNAEDNLRQNRRAARDAEAQQGGGQAPTPDQARQQSWDNVYRTMRPPQK